MTTPSLRSVAANQGFAIDPPTTWRALPRPPGELWCTPDRWAHGFRPSLAVWLGPLPASESTGYRFLAWQLGELARSVEEPVLLDCAWSGDDPCPALDLLLAHSAAGGLSLTTRQRHLRPPLGGVLIASATVADEDWPDLAAALEPSIASFRLTGEGDR